MKYSTYFECSYRKKRNLLVNQCEGNILTEAFALFVPTKVVTIKPNDQPWTNSYTRLLLRKKNRNYQFYKKINSEFIAASSNENVSPEAVTRLLYKKR